MGESSVTFKDGSTYDLDAHFPPAGRVALSMSGGVESTLLAAILADRYGTDNIVVFSGQYVGRRWWEASHPVTVCRRLGITDNVAIPQKNYHMAPADNWAMFSFAKQSYIFDLWFNGTNAKLFSGRNVTEQATIDRIKRQGYHVPFVHLEKWQTIELYYLLGKEELLKLSHSCTEQPPTRGHCGKCYCCHERAWGFHSLGKTDPTTYDIPVSQVVHNAENSLQEMNYDRERTGTAHLL